MKSIVLSFLASIFDFEGCFFHFLTPSCVDWLQEVLRRKDELEALLIVDGT